jgi:hypothetical protein
MTNRILIALMAAALLSGCGGGGGGGGGSSPAPEPPPVNTPAPPPADDPVDDAASEVVSFGTISRFGSVVVNGTVYDTDGATVSINDSPGLVSDLRVGQVVAVAAAAGSVSPVAQAISALGALEGPIESIDPVNKSFAAVGQTIFVDELTVVENSDFEDLSVGNVVRVYGYRRNSRRIRATHIERIADAYTSGIRISVKGKIESFDPDLLRFRVGTQLSDYSAAELDLGGADLADGLYVELLGSSAIDGGILPLDRIRARDRDEDRLRDRECASGCNFEVEGVITEFVSPTNFDIDGAPITTTDSTVYVNGSQALLAREVSVAISGRRNGSGVLVADEIAFRIPSTVQIEANVDAIDTQNGSLRLLGINLSANDFTLFRDVSGSPVADFWLDDLAIGDRAEVRAYPLNAGILATRVERDDAAEKVTLQAPVGAVTRPSLTLLGVTVTADGATTYRDAANQTVDADTFFGQADAGSIVKAVGDYDGASILADTLYLRDCQNGCL